jgi:uncharacterized protein (TIGR02391 family)
MNLETEIAQDLWRAVRRSYESQAWSNAILDSIHYLSDALRTRTGLQSDGTALAGQALGGKTPKLRLNRLETDSEKNIQAGVEQLLRGLYQAIRNPRSHERLADTQADADALIVFVDYLLRLLGHARASFSIDECVNRIVEPNFVPSERYASLLVEEIPVRQRLQVGLAVYHRKTEGNGRALRYFFDALVQKLAQEEARPLFEAISAELRESGDDSVLRSVLQLLNPDYWTRLDEVARLRTENRLIRNSQDGRYVRKSNKCSSGSLATWSREFWSHFTLKKELLRVLVDKLDSSNEESQDYVLKFGFYSFDVLADEPPVGLQRILAERLESGDSRFKEAIDHSWLGWT